MANVFDQFDTSSSNVFDQFDQPKHSGLADFFRSMPGAAIRGIAGTLSAGGQAAQSEMGQPIDVPSQPQIAQSLQKNITGPLPEPEGPAGRIGGAIAEGLVNPATYIGPGSLPFKLATSALSSAGGQGAVEATGSELARPIGSLASGVAGTKALGAKAPEAAIPTAAELKDAAKTGYRAATASGLELDPGAVSNLATGAEQDLLRRGYTSAVAKKTFDVLDQLQRPPAGSTVAASNLDALRRNLREIAGETQPSSPAGGFAKPTSDAAAATIVGQRLRSYVESIPASHVVAGDPIAYANAIKEANANYAAAQRVRDFDARLTKAENAADRQIAGNVASQIKSKAGQMLDNPAKLQGLTDAERAQLQTINSGTFASNVLRQVGRGHGVLPIMLNSSIALGTGGALLPYQIPLALGLLGAKKGSEALTRSQANALVDMLAKRSPLYQQRVNALPPFNNLPNQAVPFRSLMLGLPGQ